jgi:hypothetical protein
MGSSEKTTRGKEQEVEQYKEAATAALDQLQWCVNYLYGIRKREVARSLERNRATIIEQAGLRG